MSEMTRTDKLRRMAGLVVIGVSVAAFVAALLGGALVSALDVVFRLLSLGTDLGPGSYPLGPVVFVVYALGIVAGGFSSKRPMPASIGMVVLAVVAYVFGGPIAKVFGVVVGGIGVALIVSLRRAG